MIEAAVRRHRRRSCLRSTSPRRSARSRSGRICTRRTSASSLELTAREFEILQLLSQSDRVLRREEIYERVWGYAMAHGDRSVDVFVRKLRQKLRAISPDWSYIHTHFGVGYRFAPEPEGTSRSRVKRSESPAACRRRSRADLTPRPAELARALRTCAARKRAASITGCSHRRHDSITRGRVARREHRRHAGDRQVEQRGHRGRPAPDPPRGASGPGQRPRSDALDPGAAPADRAGRRADRIMPREELFRLVWGREMRAGDRSVDVYVRKLRVKLEDALPGLAVHPHALRLRLPVGGGARTTTPTNGSQLDNTPRLVAPETRRTSNEGDER